MSEAPEQSLELSKNKQNKDSLNSSPNTTKMVNGGEEHHVFWI